MTADSNVDSASAARALVNQVAALIRGHGPITTGDAAALRRMDPVKPHAAFFKLVGLVLDEHLPNDLRARMDRETRWAAIVVGLAHLGDLHRLGMRLGRSLAEARLSELRFARLLRADTDRLADELPMLARFLAARNMATDWSDAAWLILSSERGDEERARRSIAADFYRTVAHNK
jgi:CRISPR type I-E-associated protein CasB/Cse2